MLFIYSFSPLTKAALGGCRGMTSAAPQLSKRHLARRTARRRSAPTPQGHLSRAKITGAYNPALSMGILRITTGAAMPWAERSLTAPSRSRRGVQPCSPTWVSGAHAAPRAGAPADAIGTRAGSPVLPSGALHPLSPLHSHTHTSSQRGRARALFSMLSVSI